MRETEALRRDGRWHDSEQLLIKYLKGVFGGEDIYQITAARAFKTLEGFKAQGKRHLYCLTD